MVRVVLFLAVVAALALGLAWLADRPGDVAITWLGHRIETSVMVLAAAVLLLMALSVLGWGLIRIIVKAPSRLSRQAARRRERRGREAVARGLVAVGAGDARAAKRFALEAKRRAPDDPLTLLLAAQTAQLSNDPVTADQSFRAMLVHGETRLLGLHGLYIEARRGGDNDAASAIAEEATLAAPGLAWAGQAALEFRCRNGDWQGALAALDRNMRHGLLGKADFRRQRAVLLTARALALDEDGDRDGAKSCALEAVKLAPDLVPAAALAGRLLADGNEIRRAARIVEAAWRRNPHPDLADIYAHLRSGDSARERLSRIQALVEESGRSHPEAILAVARAALDAREFALARTALSPLISAPTQRVAMLMAELEETENADIGRAREWMTRAVRAAGDPVWHADGVVCDHWLPVSPVTGRIDALAWAVPVAPVPSAATVIDAAAKAEPVSPPTFPAGATVPSPVLPQAEPENPPAMPEPRPLASPQAPAPPVAQATPTSPRRFNLRAAPQPVIPLIKVPDDPGPPEPRPKPPRFTFWR